MDFGDLGLLNNKSRLASIVTVEPCELIVVHKADYNRVLRFVHNTKLNDMCNFLGTIPMFENWSLDSRRSIAQYLSFRVFAPGDVILNEG